MAIQEAIKSVSNCRTTALTLSMSGTTEQLYSLKRHMSNPGQNRPLSFGERDRRTYITYKSELEIRCENDASGNPIYIGRAKAGTAESESRWQIAFHTWDAQNSLTAKKWPENDEGAASTDYEFAWDDRATYTFV